MVATPILVVTIIHCEALKQQCGRLSTPFLIFTNIALQGGVRGVGWVGGPGLKKKSKDVSQTIFHVSDWLPTIVEGIAGIPINASSLKRPGLPQPPPLDGVNQWSVITKGSEPVRTDVLLNLSPKGACAADHCDISGRAAVRVGDWKLIRGATSVWGGKTPSYLCTTRDNVSHTDTTIPVTAATSPPWCPNGWVPSPSAGKEPVPPADVGCDNLPCTFDNSTYTRGSTWLFNLTEDPFEKNNVATDHPDVVKQLLEMINKYYNESIPQDNAPFDPVSP